ncbi:Flap endonuclease GEN 1 [Sparassis crispa]|uniref:Flap endonuclease GEN 1 n=1 Tax=Sparassis crispa TaxID=139825 RepID=A0A401H149_9APHY|nr:Flap endonuclease GEN 1 [Sparassis crispa]GBE88123.1 Flap endonuclease GEN 1 [Sparassis crispa]
MGIQHLWTLVKPAREQTTIRALSLKDGFEEKYGSGPRLYCIGVDASIWLHALQHKFAVSHAQSGENPELRTMLFRLLQYLKSPVHLIFVLDGPERPDLKRGTKVIKAGHWMVESMKLFVHAVRFDWHMAPGEAEAELACMNQTGIIDAILTEDSDVLLFGARVVIRNPKFKAGEEDPPIAMYRMSAIFSNPEIGLKTRGGLILYGLLCGNDYDEPGLLGCGSSIAVGLARYGLGQAHFLRSWRDELVFYLQMDPSGYLGQRHKKLADNVPCNFPDPTVVRALAYPVVSVGFYGPYGAARFCRDSNIDVSHLAELCTRYFTWGLSEEGVLQKFHSVLWPGLAIRLFLERAMSVNSEGVQFAPSAEQCWVKPKKTITTQPEAHNRGGVPCLRVKVKTALFVGWAKTGLRKAIEHGGVKANPDAKVPATLLVWIPRCIVMPRETSAAAVSAGHEVPRTLTDYPPAKSGPSRSGGEASSEDWMIQCKGVVDLTGLSEEEDGL